MNVEEVLRHGLQQQADQADVIDGLLDTALTAGRRRQRVRRTAIAGGSAMAAAAVVATSVVVTHDAGGRSATVIPLADGASPTNTPWWQTWTTGRHDGPVDQTFLTAARPSYDGDTAPESIDVWAAGTQPDGTDWVMFTDPHDGHVVQWLQGWNGVPDYGTSLQDVVPGMTWSSFATPTLAGHSMSSGDTPHWLVIVGRPGTTEIDYSPDGATWAPLDLQDGIGVIKVPNGYPPATAQVRLSDATGVYATGHPDGSGAAEPDVDAGNATSSPTPGGPGLATPTATQTSTPTSTPTS